MSSIWHDPLEIPLFDDSVVFIDDLGDWHTGYTQRDNDGITDHDSGEIYTNENLSRWAYIKDLLACEKELITTRKALDVAIDALDASKTLADIAGFKMLVAGIEKALEQIQNITKGE